jgi:cobalt-precorrin 5A hydrolase
MSDWDMIVAGIGCKKDAPQGSIEAVITLALEACGMTRDRLTALATHVSKRNETGIEQVSVLWGLPVLAFTTHEMDGVTDQVETHSERVVELKGVPSVAEAAALTGAGLGARLLAARVATHDATCAIAEGGGRREASQ